MKFEQLDITILKTIVGNKKYGLDFAQECSEKLFSPDLWRFGKLVVEYIKLYREVPTQRVLVERAKNNSGLVEYIGEVFAELGKVGAYDEREYKHDLEKLKTRYSEKLINGLKDGLVGGDVKKSLGEIQNVIGNIKSINQPKAYEQNTLRGSMDAFKNRYIAKTKDAGFGAGIPTGYSFFDIATGGLRDGEMLLIGADTGGGKSLLMMNMGINMYLQKNTIEMESNFMDGCDVLYFSLEMPYNDFEERVIARLSMVPQKNIRDAKLTEDEQKKVSRAMKFIKNYPYDFEIVDVPRGATIETIELIYNDIAQRRRKPKVVIVDYLTLMDYKTDDIDDWLKQGKIAEVLHEFCRVNNIVLISAVQLSDMKNNGKGTENQIGLHRIGRSKMIMHNANFAIQIEKRNNEENFPDINLHMIKARRTELTKGKAYKNLSCCAMLDVPVDVAKNDPDDISSDMNKFV